MDTRGSRSKRDIGNIEDGQHERDTDGVGMNEAAGDGCQVVKRTFPGDEAGQLGNGSEVDTSDGTQDERDSDEVNFDSGATAREREVDPNGVDVEQRTSRFEDPFGTANGESRHSSQDMDQQITVAVGRAIKEVRTEMYAVSKASSDELSKMVKKVVEDSLRNVSMAAQAGFISEAVDRAEEASAAVQAGFIPGAVNRAGRTTNVQEVSAAIQAGYIPGAVSRMEEATEGARIKTMICSNTPASAEICAQQKPNFLQEATTPVQVRGQQQKNGNLFYNMIQGDEGDAEPRYSVRPMQRQVETGLCQTEMEDRTLRLPNMGEGSGTRYEARLRGSSGVPLGEDIQGIGVKLPPFTGKESWEVWFNRFQDVADRRRWTDDRRLDILLPMLQGPSGEFVYGQLSKKIRGDYNLLINELKNRFRKIETKKAFGPKFSHREQKASETIEEFAADLKRLYNKAYPNRDECTRQEDLLRKFLDGLQDEDACFHVEYVKEPETIDEAVYEVINFQETKHMPSMDWENKKSRKPIRLARHDGDDLDSEKSPNQSNMQVQRQSNQNQGN